MRFTRRPGPQNEDLPQVEFTVDVPQSNSTVPLGPSSLGEYVSSISVGVEGGVRSLLFECRSAGIVSPSVVDEIEVEAGELFSGEITIFEPLDTSTGLRIYVSDGEGYSGPLEIEIPPYRCLEIADRLVHESPEPEVLDELVEIYGVEDEANAVFSLCGDVDRWIPLTSNFQILDAAARLSSAVDDALSTNGTESFLAKQIGYPAAEVPFQISSMRELDQVISTCDTLRYIPAVNKYNIIGKSVNICRSRQDVDQLWRIEKNFDIARTHWEGLLNDDQMTALLGRSLLEGDFPRARSLITSWLGPPRDDSPVEEDIEDAKSLEAEEAVDVWRSLLSKAAEESDKTLSYVASNYLESYLRSDSHYQAPMYLREQIYGALEVLWENIDRSSHRRAQFNKYEIRGQRLRDDGAFSAACSEFDRALEISFEEEKERGEFRSTSPEWAIFWLFSTRAEASRREEEYETAKDHVITGRDVLASMESVSNETTREHCLTRFEALLHELEGDHSLSNHKLDAARQSYGHAINRYRAIDREKEISYLVQRQKLIAASLSEQRGDFLVAKTTHEDIARNATSEDFRKFNYSRAEICAAKRAIIDMEFGSARSLIEPHLSVYNVAGVEAHHIALTLDVLESYERGDVLDVAGVFDRLDEIPEIQEVADEYPFEYGHEYRPALANILAAQRLQKLDVDQTLLDELINVSLRDVLAPDQAEQAIEEWGIRDIGLEERWKYSFPTHIVHRFQEVEADEIGTRENYADRGLALLKLVEQTLEFTADYYGQREIGHDWKDRLSRNDDGHLTFQSLRDFLNKDVMDEYIWRDSVRDLVDEPLIGAEDTIDARNMLGHDRQIRLSIDEYREVKRRVIEIFARMESDLPVLGEIEEEHVLGSYIFKPHWENPQKWFYLKTDADLVQDTVYYLPPKSLSGESVVDVEPDDVVECSAGRVLDNVNVYANIE